MTNPSFIAQVFARDPRSLVRFPEAPLEQAMTELRGLSEAISEAHAAAAKAMAVQSPESNEPPPSLNPATLAALATNVWRARAKLIDSSTNQPYADARRAMRHIEASLEGLQQLHVVIKDFSNEVFDPGMPLKVLAYQPSEGIIRDTVIEVLRPTILWQDKVLQLGEVVVGTPENAKPISPLAP